MSSTSRTSQSIQITEPKIPSDVIQTDSEGRKFVEFVIREGSGPNRADLFNHVERQFDKGSRNPIEFSVYPRGNDKERSTARPKILGLSHEDGSGSNFWFAYGNVHFYSNSTTLNYLNGHNAEGYYNVSRRTGFFRVYL